MHADEIVELMATAISDLQKAMVDFQKEMGNELDKGYEKKITMFMDGLTFLAKQVASAPAGNDEKLAIIGPVIEEALVGFT